jgi:hypothetical protein
MLSLNACTLNCKETVELVRVCHQDIFTINLSSKPNIKKKKGGKQECSVLLPS